MEGTINNKNLKLIIYFFMLLFLLNFFAVDYTYHETDPLNILDQPIFLSSHFYPIIHLETFRPRVNLRLFRVLVFFMLCLLISYDLVHKFICLNPLKPLKLKLYIRLQRLSLSR